ncbi:hypothetical protein [Fodinibius saliphilus]|uniref:hypothetical protein n=1 Tax=Fodinibius saliphilus TaxID=1920650 RepID=UPI0011099699|nr:hypothetical protein [Fodinibius saliphilus]
MNDYSDIIFLMGAMIVFSLLTLQTSRLFQMNNQVKINGEVEYNAIAIAQDQVDQIRWLPNKPAFNTYVDNFPKTISVPVQSDTLDYNISINVSEKILPNADVESHKITVSVTNKFMKNRPNAAPGSRAVKLEFLKSFDT